MPRDKKVDNSRFLALDHDINSLRCTKAGGFDRRLSYGIANAFNIIRGDYSIASPRKWMLNHCEPRKARVWVG